MRVFVLDAERLQLSLEYASLEVLGVSLAHFGGWRKLVGLPQLVRKIRRSLKHFDPDCVISFMTQTNVLTGAAIMGMRAKHVACERVHPPCAPFVALQRPGWFFQGIRNYFYKRASVVVVQASSALQTFPFAIQKLVTVIPNMLPLPVGEDGPSRSPRIVCVSRLVPQKNLYFLIEVFSELHDRYPDWRLVLFGSGPEEKGLREECKRRGLEDSFLFGGVVSDITPELRKSSIAVLTSLYEGFPNTVAEAMSVGLPVVALDSVGGIRDLVKEGENGFLVPVGAKDLFVERVATLIEDRELQVALGNSGKSLVQRFAPPSVLRMWEELLERIT